MSPRHLSPCLPLILLLIGCESNHPLANADLSTPKSAALVYLTAIQKGDAKTAISVSVGSAEQKRWVDALATMVDGMRSFDNALYAKFGRISNQVHTDLNQSLLMLADGPVVWIGDGSVAFDETRARIDPKGKSFASKSQPSIYLKLEKEHWLVNLAETYAQNATADQLKQMSASFATYREIGQAMRAAAHDTLSGKFHSIDEANQALGERVKAIKDDASTG